MNILETIQNIREQLTSIETQFTTIRDSLNSMVSTDGGKKRMGRPPKTRAADIGQYETMPREGRGIPKEPKKRKMSKEGRARIAAAAKARWAKVKAKGGNKL
jgi:hypothetical protein